MMRVREEVESMQLIFRQVHLLLNGSGSLNRGNLTMISIHNLMATLTGCVIVYTRLEKVVNEVCGFNGIPCLIEIQQTIRVMLQTPPLACIAQLRLYQKIRTQRRGLTLVGSLSTKPLLPF